MLKIIINEDITHVSLVPHIKVVNGCWINSTLFNRKDFAWWCISHQMNYQLPVISFGMTETCSQFLTASPKMLSQRYDDTVGKPSDNVKVKIKIRII